MSTSIRIQQAQSSLSEALMSRCFHDESETLVVVGTSPGFAKKYKRTVIRIATEQDLSVTFKRDPMGLRVIWGEGR